MKFPPKLTRRQMLLGGFFGGATLSLSVSHLRHHRDDFLEQVQGAQLGFEMHTVADKLPELESQPPLVKPTEPYDSEAAILLVRCCRLATEQYMEGKDNPDYQGEIDILPSYQSIFDVADQLAAFQAPTQASLLTSLLNKTLLRDAFKRTDNRFFGYALISPRSNLIVYRGTQEPDEWIANLETEQSDYGDPPIGRVHRGFLFIYEQYLRAQTRDVVDQMNPELPLYITGHSLGGALAILAAMDIASYRPDIKSQLRVYNFGAPRVGNPQFARAYSKNVPNTYRIVNLADSAPTLPPTLFEKSLYIHVGEEWSFVYQTGNLSPNHQLPAYSAALKAGLESNENRPVLDSGF